jgi:hypothetical protein
MYQATEHATVGEGWAATPSDVRAHPAEPGSQGLPNAQRRAVWCQQANCGARKRQHHPILCMMLPAADALPAVHAGTCPVGSTCSAGGAYIVYTFAASRDDGAWGQLRRWRAPPQLVQQLVQSPHQRNSARASHVAVHATYLLLMLRSRQSNHVLSAVAPSGRHHWACGQITVFGCGEYSAHVGSLVSDDSTCTCEQRPVLHSTTHNCNFC